MNKEKEGNAQLMKSEAKRLWTECFSDEQDFVDFYFDKVFKAEECKLLFNEQGQGAIVHIHLPVYRFALSKGLEIKANYISGACTDKAFRKQGLMSKMLKEVLLEAKEEGELSASFLVPASDELAEYYRKHFGYESLVYHQTTNYLAEILAMSEHIELDESFEEAIPFLMYCEQAMKKSHIRHSAEQWACILAEYGLNPQVSKVQAFYTADGKIEALALYRLNAEQKEIFIDALYGTKVAKSNLLDTIKGQYPLYEIKAYLCKVKEKRDAQTYIMWRPIDFMPFLIAYAHKNRELEMSLVVEDDLTQERKAYHIAGGEVQEDAEVSGKVYSVRDFVKNFVLVEYVAFLHE